MRITDNSQLKTQVAQVNTLMGVLWGIGQILFVNDWKRMEQQITELISENTRISKKLKE